MVLVQGLHFNNLRSDVYGGMVAAIAARTLAVASGIKAIPDLYGTIFLDFLASLFGCTLVQFPLPPVP